MFISWKIGFLVENETEKWSLFINMQSKRRDPLGSGKAWLQTMIYMQDKQFYENNWEGQQSGSVGGQELYAVGPRHTQPMYVYTSTSHKVGTLLTSTTIHFESSYAECSISSYITCCTMFNTIKPAAGGLSARRQILCVRRAQS